MVFLEKYGYTTDEINDFIDKVPEEMINALNKVSKLVDANLDYLKNLGVTNLKEIFNAYYELFMADHSTFVNIFNKYDREDLIEKLAKNVAIIEYL